MSNNTPSALGASAIVLTFVVQIVTVVWFFATQNAAINGLEEDMAAMQQQVSSLDTAQDVLSVSLGRIEENVNNVGKQMDELAKYLRELQND